MRQLFIKIAAVLAVLTLFAGCKKEAQKSPQALAIVGEWNYENGAVSEEQQESVYIAFNADNTFELFQKIGAGVYKKLTGTYTVEGTLLSGVYDGGTPWKAKYNITDVNSATLTLKSAWNAEYVITYTKKAIPEEVRNHYDSDSKALVEGFEPFL